jgi:hypothetical protein
MAAPLIRAAIEGWAVGRGAWLLLDEHQADSRIADVVLARIDSEALEERLSRDNVRPLCRSEIVLLRSMRADCGTSENLLTGRMAVSSTTVRRIIRPLEAEGYLEKTATGAFRRLYAPRPIVSRFVSFEAKRSDWRSALAQAAAHRLFANESYVACDSEYVGRFNRASAYFKTAGIGLCSVDIESGKVTRVLSAARARPIDPVSVALSNEQVLRMLLGSETRQLPQTRLPSAGAQSACRAALMSVGQCSRSLAHLLAALAAPPLVECPTL